MSEQQDWSYTPGESDLPPQAADPIDDGWWRGYLAWDPADEPPAGPPAPGPQPTPPAPHHQDVSARLALAVGASLITLALAMVAVFGLAVRQHGGSNRPRAEFPGPSNLAIFPQQAGVAPSVATIASKVEAGVVNINSRIGNHQGIASGTGMVLTSNGEILTNYHVIDGATSISVTDLGNNRTYSASVVGTDPQHDIAVLQLQGASGLQTIPLGDSSKVASGDSVIALGNALGTGGPSSVATGQVTALNQSITATDQNGSNAEDLNGLIQTSVPLQPGDSGGPLVDSNGRVVGIDTAASVGFRFHRRQVTSSATGAEAYAVPINEALSVAKQIMSSK